MITVPLVATPSQRLQVTLGDQDCRIAIYQKTTGMFIDLSVAGVPIMSGVLCHDRSRIVRYAYLGFIGDLLFVDTQGRDDPQYAGLGSRWLLGYAAPVEASAFP